jgi:signal transduction histidine kinase
MRTTDPQPSTAGAYRRETELLMARRIPLTITLFLACVGASGILEYHYFPARLPYFLGFFAAEAALCVLLLGLRRTLLRRHWMIPAATLTTAALGGLMTGYGSLTDADPQLLATGMACLLAGLSLLLPWGVRGQIYVTAAVLVAFSLWMVSEPLASVPPPYAFLGVFSAGLVSAFGARHLDLQRFAIFREIMLKEDAAFVNRALLRMTSELNSSLEASVVLERIARGAREALSCDWSTLLLWDDRHDAFRVAASAAHQLRQFDDARGIDLGIKKFPLLARVLRSEDLLEVTEASPRDDGAAAMLAYFGTRSMLVAAMIRGGRVVGLMVAGRTNNPDAFSLRQKRLMRGIAHQAAVALENARLVADLRHADRMKSEFVATMSHELRTPLNIIIGYNELLAEGTFGNLDAAQREIIERVQQNSIDLLTLINATLDVNRLEAGSSLVDVVDFRVADLLAEIRAEAERLPRSDRVALRFQINGTATLRSDPHKLKIILRNLIANAVKFTDRGEISVSATHTNGGPAEFSVTDTGIGIPTHELPNIFGMFRQVKSTTRPTNGVGLGLYIVHRFVAQLGGEIDVDSTLGVGTTFHVRIPHLEAGRPADDRSPADVALPIARVA